MEENVLELEDILEYITAYASESEYLINNVLGVLALYEDGIWYFDTVYADKETGQLLYVFTDDETEEVVKVKPDVFLARELMDEMLYNYILRYTKGQAFSFELH